MSTLPEIESAIRQLPKSEFLNLADWIVELKEDGWDSQMESDTSAGRLDFLFDEADAGRAEGKNRLWPRYPPLGTLACHHGRTELGVSHAGLVHLRRD